MITLREIMDNLTYGELSHVSIGGGDLGFIADKHFPKVVSCLNGALTALHKRFLLRTGEVHIQQYAAVSTYYLRPEYTVSAGTPGKFHYLLDSTADPFPKNVFKIESVTSSTGIDLPINDTSQLNPVYTPNFDTLVMTPNPDLLDIVLVRYRADHPLIKVTPLFDPELIELHIPTSILDAISLNIASRIYTPLTVGDGDKSAAQSYMYQYELECKRLELEGIALDAMITVDSRFEDNGWV